MRAVQRLKGSNLFIAVAAELWGLKLLCCPCLPVLCFNTHVFHLCLGIQVFVSAFLQR